MSTSPRILIVDGSRVVRASLAKHLSDHFEIVEEDNGESAWQTLVLDTRIVAAVAAAQLPKISGLELVERLRENRLGRLKNLPFFLIISDSETEEGKHRAKALGVSDFLTKGLKKDEIMRRVGAQVKPSEDATGPGEEASAGICAPAAHRLPEAAEQPRLLSRQEVEAKLHQSLDFSDDRDDPVSVVVLEVGNYGSLVSDLGQEVADKICGRFSQLLLSTIRGNDCIGLYSTQRCVIVSQGVGFAQCSAFADRLKASIAAARIAVQGQPVKLAVDAGVASAPEDGTLSPEELLSLAAMRMKTGGGSKRKVAVARKAWLDMEIPALRALSSLLVSTPDEVEPFLGTLGVEVIPLLKAIDREFGFGLPLPEMERRLSERAQEEGATQ